MGIYFGGNGYYPQPDPPYSEFPLWIVTSSGPIPSTTVTFSKSIRADNDNWIDIVDWVSQQLGNDDWLSMEIPQFPYQCYDLFIETQKRIFPSVRSEIFSPPLALDHPENPLWNQGISSVSSGKISTKLLGVGQYGEPIPDYLAYRRQSVTGASHSGTNYHRLLTTMTCGAGYPYWQTPFGYEISCEGYTADESGFLKRIKPPNPYDSECLANINIPIFPSSWIKGGKLDPDGTLNGDTFIPSERPGFLTFKFKGSPYSSSSLTASYGTANNFTFSADYYNFLKGREISTLETDPYKPGGTSGGGGGGGSFQSTSTPIALPGLPTIQVTDTGFLTLYNPTPVQIKALANYMWSTGFSLDDFKKIFADPISAIIGLQLLPVSVPNGSAVEVTIGNIATGVSMFPVTNQWVTHSCGSITIPEFWGSYLDFNPYTKLQIFLPFIGVRDLNADDIIGKSLQLQYNVDVLSGACVASLACAGTTLYSWQGSCGLQIPFTSNTFSNLLGSILQVAGAGVAIAGASSVGAVAAAGLSAASGMANAMKNDIRHGGNSSGAGGFLSVKTPYIILSRPRLCRPADQNKYIGYPSFINVSLSDLAGFTRVEEIHIENVPATSAELEEIESLLKSGVIF